MNRRHLMQMLAGAGLASVFEVRLSQAFGNEQIVERGWCVIDAASGLTVQWGVGNALGIGKFPLEFTSTFCAQTADGSPIANFGHADITGIKHGVQWVAIGTVRTAPP